MIARPVTERLSEGLGLLRWGDTEGTVRGLYPTARTTSGYEGRDPQTGQLIHVPPLPIIADILPIKSRLQVTCVAEFRSLVRPGARQTPGFAGLWSLFLTPQAGPGTVEDRLACLNELATRLNFGPVDPDAGKQEWKVMGCRLQLSFQKDDFKLTIHRPGGD